MRLHVGTKVFLVMFTSRGESAKWKASQTIMVLAEDCEKALEQFRLNYPVEETKILLLHEIIVCKESAPEYLIHKGSIVGGGL